MLFLALTVQAAAPDPGARVRLADLGVASVDEVRRGRVAVVHGADGPRLEVRLLSAEWRPRPAEAGSPLEPWLEGGAGRTTPERPAAAGGPDRRLVRALWVWNTAELLRDEAARSDFLAFVGAEGFTRVFLHLALPEGARARSGFVPFEGAGLAPLVVALHERGVEVDALDGDPRYALPGSHEGVVRTVARVVAWNRTAEPAARFDGVRYDIEPYLVPGWSGAGRRALLDGWVRVVADLARVARDGGLRVGLDVPFWLDGPDEETGAWLRASLDGEEAPVLVHLFRAADEVAVMGYRTRLEGGNGVLALVQGELALGAALGTRVLVALESEPLPDEELVGFRGEPRRGVPGPGGRWIVAVPAGEGLATVRLLRGDEGRRALRDELARRGLPDSAVRAWRAEASRTVPGSRLSFHREGYAAMEEAAAGVAEALGDRPAFGGTAFHHWGSLRSLREDR